MIGATERPSLVTLKSVKVQRADDLGLFCEIGAASVFVPLNQIYGRPADLRAGEVMDLAVPEWFAREHGLIG